MPTFSISISDEECAPIDEEARKNERSRSAQVRFILGQWLEQRNRHDPEEREVKP